ncbi:MAG: hypothetical protein PHP17_04155, partial [Candidatus Omnitrophica bacterium]|nr:hypothetical protein [Candidatus Omnitrophota bacterium]
MSKTKVIIVSVITAASILAVSFYMLVWLWFVSPAVERIQLIHITARLAAAEDLYRKSGGNNVLLRGYVDDFFTAGKLSLESKKYGNAIAFYTAGLEIDCWRPDKIFELGLVYEKKGMYDEAYKRFNQALNSNPGLIVYLKAKLHINAIKNKVKQAGPFTEELNIGEGKLKAKTIYILDFGVSDREMIEDLRVLLQDVYKVRFAFLGDLKEPINGFDKQRAQFFVEPLFENVRSQYEDIFSSPDTQAILVVTPYDITDGGVNFLFGKSDAQYGVG